MLSGPQWLSSDGSPRFKSLSAGAAPFTSSAAVISEDPVQTLFFGLFFPFHYAVTGRRLRSCLWHSSVPLGKRPSCLPRRLCRSGRLYRMDTFRMGSSPIFTRHLPPPGISPDSVGIHEARGERQRGAWHVSCLEQETRRAADQPGFFSAARPSSPGGSFDRVSGFIRKPW